MGNICIENHTSAGSPQHHTMAEERIGCFFYTWRPEGTSMEHTNEVGEEMIVMNAEEQQRQIEEELEYLNSWDRVLEWL